MKRLILNFFILSLLILKPQAGLASNKTVLNCTHTQVCNSLKYLTANQQHFVIEQSIDLNGQDPHHFEPKVGDIKKLIQSQNLILAPYKVQPWLKSIEKKRNHSKSKGKVTIQAKASSEHFWLKLDSLCLYLKTLNLYLQEGFQSYLNQEDRLNRQCQQLQNNLISDDSNPDRTIILLHDSLTNFLKNKGFKVISLRGHGHHQKITPRSIKKLKNVIKKSKKLTWIIESQIHYPSSLKKMIKPHHQVIEIDTLGSFGLLPWEILKEVSKRLDQ